MLNINWREAFLVNPEVFVFVFLLSAFWIYNFLKYKFSNYEKLMEYARKEIGEYAGFCFMVSHFLIVVSLFFIFIQLSGEFGRYLVLNYF